MAGASVTVGTAGELRLPRTLERIEELVDMTHSHTLRSERHHLSPFWRHFLQMLAVMMVGMFVGAAVLVTAVGSKTWDEVTTEYGTHSS